MKPVTLWGHALTTSWWDLALLSSVEVNAEAVAAEASPVDATVRGGAGVYARARRPVAPTAEDRAGIRTSVSESDLIGYGESRE